MNMVEIMILMGLADRPDNNCGDDLADEIMIIIRTVRWRSSCCRRPKNFIFLPSISPFRGRLVVMNMMMMMIIIIIMFVMVIIIKILVDDDVERLS